VPSSQVRPIVIVQEVNTVTKYPVWLGVEGEPLAA
jgi:hypothetical protein